MACPHGAEAHAPPVWAVLLAAGESTRMGRLKPLLPFLGGPLVAYQVRALLLAGVAGVVVVLGHRAEEVAPAVPALPSVHLVHNPRYREGKATSVRAGVAGVPEGAEGLLLLAVDQPRPPWVHRLLLEAFRRERPLILQPEYEGRGGHPVLFASPLRGDLLGVEEATQGIRAVLVRHAKEVRRVPVPDPVVRLDLNTPVDYASALERFQREGWASEG